MPRLGNNFGVGGNFGTTTDGTNTTNNTTGATGSTPAGGAQSPSDRFGVGAGGANPIATGQPLNPQQAAVKKFRDLVKTGKLDELYSAIKGSDAAKKKEALDFFATLPKINAETSVADLAKLGVITKAPAGLDAVLKSARYVPGRQVQIETNIETKRPSGWGDVDQTDFLKYKEGGHLGLTHRASIQGEKGDSFLVKVDGRDTPLEIKKSKVYDLNQPQVYKGDRFTLNGVVVDYADPIMKAKILECYTKMDDILGQLDFNKALTGEAAQAPGGLAGFYASKPADVAELQKKAIRVVHDAINMSYSHDTNWGDSAARLAVQGNGQCYTQAAVMAGLLYPFKDILAIDIRFINGKVYRNAHSDPPYDGGNHGWLQVTLRPSMETAVVDRTWGQPWTKMDRAYSWTGDRVPRGIIHASTGGLAQVASSDQDFSGKVSIKEGKREFGIKGQDDRDAHHL